MQVVETTYHTGRFSVSMTPDVPFKEMASHCEALLMGKQQKMSAFLSAQQKQEWFLAGLPQDPAEDKQSFYLQTHQFNMVSMSSLSSFHAYSCAYLHW